MNLNSRIISSIILIPLIISALFLLPINFFGYFIIFISTLAAWEWTQFIGLTKQTQRISSAILFGFTLLILQFSFKDLKILIKEPLIFFILLISLMWWTTATILIITFPNSAKFWSKSVILKILFGILTILPFYCGTLFLKSINYCIRNFIGDILLLYIISLVWVADIGAYCFGYLFGKHKLAKKLSPNKTFEGALGGILFSGIFSWLFSSCIQIWLISNNLLIYSIFITIISILGDLTESMFKRQLGINNSSNLIPGHGGILDRIDSLTSAIPIFSELILFSDLKL